MIAFKNLPIDPSVFLDASIFRKIRQENPVICFVLWYFDSKKIDLFDFDCNRPVSTLELFTRTPAERGET